MSAEQSHERPNRAADIEAYIQSVRENRHTERTGDWTNRISGTFVLQREGRNDLHVRYVGSNHEVEMIDPSKHSPSPSGAEQAFICKHLFGGQSRTMLVEAGDGRHTRNHVEAVCDHIVQSNPVLEADRMPRQSSSIYDMDLSSAEAASRGYDVYNIDVVENPAGYRYILQHKGEKELIEYLCFKLQDDFAHPLESLPLMISAVLRETCPGHTVTDETISSVCEAYLPILLNPAEHFDAWRQELDNKGEGYVGIRDEFMVQSLREFPGNDVVMLMHTGHLLQVLDKTKHEITSFEAGPSEKAAKVVEEEERFRRQRIESLQSETQTLVKKNEIAK